MAIEKILSCICVLVILMSVMQGTVFALDSGDNTTEHTNRSNVLEEAFTEKSVANEIMPFLTNEPNSSKVVSAQGECASVVKFKGTATTDENKVDCCICYGSYYCNVKVEELLSNPGNKLKTGNEYIVCYGDSPKNIKTGDKLEVYGEYYQTCGPFQYVGNVIAFKSDDVEFDYDYYIKKKSSECLSISVWTDKSEYNIGETVTIYYQTNTACTAKLTVTKPDGTQVVVGGPNDIPVCTRSKSAAAGYPTGTRTVTFEAWTDDESKEATCYFDVVEDEEETKPDPEITKVEYPTTCVKEDEYATISVTVANNGGASNEGYISVSFPNDEDVYVVSGTGNEYNKVYPKGSEIWGKDGKIPSSKDPLVELYDIDWDGGQKETITMNVKPNSGSDEIEFLVRAALKNDADGDYERDPTYSGDTDQQGWYAEKYSVDVCDILYEIKIKGEVIEPDNEYLDDLFDCKVKIDRIITNPGNMDIKEGDEVLVEKFIWCDPGGTVDDWYVETGDKVEVYGKISKGDFSCSGHSDSSFRLDLCGSSSYYFKKICLGPDPEITKVEYPTACVNEGEYATISVTVANNGGASSEGYISVSFPNDEDVSGVSGTGNEYNKL